MRIWKQLLLSVAILFAGGCLWITLSPDAARAMVRMGIPAGVVAYINPSALPLSDAPVTTARNSSPSPARQGQGQGQGQGGGNRSPLVVTEKVTTGTVNDRLSAIGSGEAIQSVVVMPQSSGTITEILVSSGQKVRRGDVLARLDSEEQRIERDKAQVALRSAKEKSASYRNLQSVTRLEALDAQIAEEAAKLALSTAELNLKRRDIAAPIDGIAGIVAVNIGDNVTTQTSVVTVDDRSDLLVDFWAPERFATSIHAGMPVEATAIGRPGQTFTGDVQAVDNRVDPASRTIRVRARLKNDSDMLRAGMSFNVSMRFAGDTFPAVDPLAVQWDGEGAFVWHVREAKSFKQRVRIIQRNADSVLVDAAVKPGDFVVTEGLQRVREGAPVRLSEGRKTEEVASQ
ncbi:efflux RND transporter periplasmic adaptor subunit [Rhizobium oryzicola]|uniref:Efflux RND transporter periplasmic adaptor subunit n=1 Tax=Rhizobium oryzicola TaxID=1232668 RepID=A0ABT8T140_9HYPH|nr:efflux RND transporter periplasmic adaptor subunit [Rhizobium oryzicola]MDO1584469.1 efflux RND transporter periplasmic adaptor subunit [Rhizobium oryzicola]